MSGAKKDLELQINHIERGKNILFNFKNKY